MAEPLTGIELRSLITTDGKLRISLDMVELDRPAPGELLVRVEAAPINPSDIGLLFGPADVSTMQVEKAAAHPILTADVPAQRLPVVQPRIGQSLAVGNEGAGTVIEAGADLQHLIGRKVAMIGGAMYAQLRKLPIGDCMVLPENANAAEGASLFVNPLTALGFTETMRAEGHKAIVHTAAASNLGHMLVRLCLADSIPLVNIVRSEAQAALLRGIGATHIIDSTAPDFQDQLVNAIADTGATIGFDAIGGGKLASQILIAMESVAARNMASYSRYGSDSLKKVYIYGALDLGPTILNRTFGFSWDVGGWLLFPFLRNAGPATASRMRERVANEFRTTFASHYTATISLADVLKPEIAAEYLRRSTGAKYLVDPSL
jgi:NADPH:quinone reductase-like Zn-dependent oxidoreductase